MSRKKKNQTEEVISEVTVDEFVPSADELNELIDSIEENFTNTVPEVIEEDSSFMNPLIEEGFDYIADIKEEKVEPTLKQVMRFTPVGPKIEYI